MSISKEIWVVGYEDGLNSLHLRMLQRARDLRGMQCVSEEVCGTSILFRIDWSDKTREVIVTREDDGSIRLFAPDDLDEDEVSQWNQSLSEFHKEVLEPIADTTGGVSTVVPDEPEQTAFIMERLEGEVTDEWLEELMNLVDEEASVEVIEDRTYYSFPDSGFELCTNVPGGLINTIFFYSGKTGAEKEFPYELPEALSWKDDRDKVRERLGDPDRSSSLFNKLDGKTFHWDMFGFEDYCLHVEYDDDFSLRLITVMVADTVPDEG
ncbi:MAG: hypothetical protein K8F91_05395 [Candidatus Obscuribacterales bacterium]|nr:hypothetical protein [Candidatus Obscuribacterales bacterium]